MTTIQKRNLMVEAHKMAKKMVGDYQARLALAMRKAWQKIKNKKEEKEMTKDELIKSIQEECENEPENKFGHKWSAKRWKKYGKDRLYINRTNGRNRDSKGYIDLNDVSADNLNVPPEMGKDDLATRLENVIAKYNKNN